MPSFALNRYTLTFRDSALEQDYRRDFDERNRVFYLLGIVLSVLGWLSVVFDAEQYNPAETRMVAILIFTLLMPLFGFIIFIVATKRLIRLYQPLCALANLVAGLLIVYVGLFVIQSLTLTIAFVIAVAFFCFFILRVRFPMAVVVCVLYMVACTIALPAADFVPAADRTSLTAGIPILLLCCVLGGYALERSSRRLYAQERTIEHQKGIIEAEHERSERLLLNILPPEIASRLKAKEEIIADSYDEASVLFCDICDFTPLSAELTAEELVAFLNELFSLFDGLVDRYGLEKIKTIGDAYMVVAGVPQPAPDHAQKVMQLAVDMLAVIEARNATAERPTSIRIGISSGPVVAGVIGTKKFLFDLWGDTVNTAARMESYGIPGTVQVSAATHALVADHYPFEPRGRIEIKGKGEMETYLHRPG